MQWSEKEVSLIYSFKLSFYCLNYSLLGVLKSIRTISSEITVVYIILNAVRTVKTTFNWTTVSKLFRIKICVYACRSFRLFVSRFIVYSYQMRLFVYSYQIRLFVYSYKIVRLFVSNCSFIPIKIFVYTFQLSNKKWF